MNNQLKSKLDLARNIIQVKQEEQYRIFDKVISDLNISDDPDIDVLVDYCFNNTEWNDILDKITK
mgnify:FL=1|jgi:hypothetical protein